MQTKIEVLFTPAEFGLLPKRDLSRTVCVVFDVLRATSSMVAALANGAAGILPVAEIPEAVTFRQRDAEALLAGERDGVRIDANLTGTVAFDLGNSPREFMADKVRGKKIVMTTTNGTRALRACAGAKVVLLGSFLNLGRTAAMLLADMPESLLLVCSGTFEEMALEDVLGAGALLELLAGDIETKSVADSLLIARDIYQTARNDLLGAISRSRNGKRLLSRPELKDDVAFCAQRDVFEVIAAMDKDGWVRKV